MAKDNAQSSFQRGVMSLLILSLLDQEDMYGIRSCRRSRRAAAGPL